MKKKSTFKSKSKELQILSIISNVELMQEWLREMSSTVEELIRSTKEMESMVKEEEKRISGTISVEELRNQLK